MSLGTTSLRRLGVLVAFLVIAIGLPAAAQTGPVTEGDIGWSATNNLQSNNFGRISGEPDKNPIPGLWAVAEVRFQGKPVEPLAPSRGRKAGVLIWTDNRTSIVGFDGCNEFEGSMFVHSNVLEIQASSFTPTMEQCGSLRYQGVIRRALSSSPKIVSSSNEWSIDVQGMYVRFVRSTEGELQLGTAAFSHSLGNGVWRATSLNGQPVNSPRPVVWFFDQNGPSVFDGCQTLRSNRQIVRTWREPSLVEFAFTFEIGNPQPPRVWSRESGCPTEVDVISTQLRAVLATSFTIARAGQTLRVTADGLTMELEAVAKSKFRAVPFSYGVVADGQWEFVSLTESGVVIQPPNRLRVLPPHNWPEGTISSDGCNNFSVSAFEFDGKYFGSAQPLTTLPCSSGARFASLYRRILTNSEVTRVGDEMPRIGDTVALQDGDVIAMFAYRPYQVPAAFATPAPPILGPVLTGRWDLSSASIEGQALAIAMPRVFAGLTSLTFRNGRRVDYWDGCNSHSGAQYSVIDGKLLLIGGRRTLVYCSGAGAHNTAVVVSAAVTGQVTITKTTMTFRRGDAVAVFRKRK